MSQDKISRVGINTLSIIAGRTLNLLIQLIVSISIANYLGDFRYGQFNLALTFIGFFDILVNFGTTQITIREIVANPKQTNTILGSVLAIRFTFLFISIGLGMLIASVLNYDQTEIILIIIFFTNFVFSTRLASIRKTLESPFESHLRMVFVTLLQIIDSFIMLATILIAIQKNASLSQLALAYVLANAPGTLIIAFWGFKQFHLRPHISYPKIRHLLTLGFPVMLFRLFSNVNTRLDVLIVDYFRGSSEVGLYSAATRLIYPLFFVASSLSVSFLPLLTSYRRERNGQFSSLFILGIKLLIMAGLGVGYVIYFKGEGLLRILYTEEYIQATSAFSVLGLSLVFIFLNFYFVDFLIVINKQKIATGVMAIVASFNVIVNFILIPKYGFLAAAYTTLISYVLGCALFAWRSFEQIGIKLKFNMIWIKYFLYCGTAFLIGYSFRSYTIWTFLLLFIPAFTLLTVIFKILNPKDRELIALFFAQKKAYDE